MARSIDRLDGVTTPSLPYERPIAADLVRIVTAWTDDGYRAAVATRAGVDPRLATPVFVLAEAGALRPGILAHRLHASPPTTSRLLADLAAAGLAARIPDPDDARAALVVLTDAGRRAAAALAREGDRLIDELTADWSQRERESFAAGLRRFAAAVTESQS